MDSKGMVIAYLEAEARVEDSRLSWCPLEQGVVIASVVLILETILILINVHSQK